MLRGEGKNSDSRNQKDRSNSPDSPALPRQVKPGKPGHPGTLNSPVKRRNPRASTVDTRGFRSVYLSLITKGKKGGLEVPRLRTLSLRSPSPRPRCSQPYQSRRKSRNRRRSRGSHQHSGTAPTESPGTRWSRSLDVYISRPAYLDISYVKHESPHILTDKWGLVVKNYVSS